MNIRLHIERLVVDEGVLARGERDGLTQAIGAELLARLDGPAPPRSATGDGPATPAYIVAIGDAVLARVPLPADVRGPIDGGPR